MIILHAKSTGIMSNVSLLLHMMLLMVPRPISKIMPVMPLILSTQPGYGSDSAHVTIDGRTIVMGNL